ncbi:heavy-metal-associated domain-containing protein [Arthrobacter sp. SDTb3-6]|uniref:heavy-metal-associated domain-containing protein n=1 Tax=Arthrobacter sp. SDTb3-6 TaxID=2713571 RepID=UPI00159EB118|nr:heavy-metal-associated domain-containing protein [Arthrobacter sp. SDTb3-6]NVN00276.1 heavy-metal-associated domain-containing protein [Arthrobacter sp. SDTb3-6]
MCGTNNREDLKLTPVQESSCACCSTPAISTQSADTSGTVYELEGLTCGHCVQTVEKAVRAVTGADSVAVTLVAGSASTLTVAGPVNPETVRAAVVTAGYTVL